MPDDRTQAVYARKAAEYAKIASAEEYPDIRDFIARLPDGCRVLDFGCGPGLDALIMAQGGILVDAWDASAEMLSLIPQHANIRPKLASFDALNAVSVYQGVWANFSLLHVPKAELPRILTLVRTSLMQGGVFSLAVKRGTSEMRDKLGRFYALYEEDEMTEMLTNTGFDIETTRHGEGRGLSGTVDPFFRMTCHA